MCTRYRFRGKLLDRLPEDEFREVRIPPPFETRYNFAPQQRGPILRLEGDGAAKVELLPWGFRSHYRSQPLLNARSETAHKLPAFSRAYRERRCLVLLNGYYEWEHRLGFSKPIPWHFHFKDDGLMVFAGLWQNFEGEDRYTFLTTEPNDMVKRISHDRMPLILPRESWQTWLNPDTTLEQLGSLLRPFPPDQMEMWSVTNRMNSWKFESPECLNRVDPATEAAPSKSRAKKAKAEPPKQQPELF